MRFAPQLSYALTYEILLPQRRSSDDTTVEMIRETNENDNGEEEIFHEANENDNAEEAIFHEANENDMDSQSEDEREITLNAKKRRVVNTSVKMTALVARTDVASTSEDDDSVEEEEVFREARADTSLINCSLTEFFDLPATAEDSNQREDASSKIGSISRKRTISGSMKASSPCGAVQQQEVQQQEQQQASKRKNSYKLFVQIFSAKDLQLVGSSR
jgi:hypothetical protein